MGTLDTARQHIAYCFVFIADAQSFESHASPNTGRRKTVSENEKRVSIDCAKDPSSHKVREVEAAAEKILCASDSALKIRFKSVPAVGWGWEGLGEEKRPEPTRKAEGGGK